MERTVGFMSALRLNLEILPEDVLELLNAPPGSVVLFTSTVTDIVGGVFTPQDELRAGFNTLLPMRCCFSTSLQVPLRCVNACSGFSSLREFPLLVFLCQCPCAAVFTSLGQCCLSHSPGNDQSALLSG